ncbi:MAG: EF-Tu/IF-2/RF-3 family GTPase, partial [Patescibacteria group bacterium]
LLGSDDEIFFVSGKTGEGVGRLLEAVIEKIPPPKAAISNFSAHGGSASGGQFPISKPARALVFDSFYDNHRGVIASVRVFDGEIKDTDEIYLIATETESRIKEIGCFTPQLKALQGLASGEIGYIATGIKDPSRIKIGDTILIRNFQFPISNFQTLALPGYKEPQPVVFVSFYPESSDDYGLLKISLDKLRLNDSALKIEPDQNEVLGRGFKVGFLGRLHFEITGERLKREFGIATTNTFPSVIYRIKTKKVWKEIVKPEDLPQDFEEIWEPIVRVEIIIAPEYVNNFYHLQNIFRMSEIKTSNFQANVKIDAKMPLSELISDFDDKLKSITEGYASFSYEMLGFEKADVLRVDIHIAGELVPGLSRFLPKTSFEREARVTVGKLKELLPKQQFAQSLQAVEGTKVIAREDIPALKKDVTGYLYGGDRTRKMKLWK